MLYVMYITPETLFSSEKDRTGGFAVPSFAMLPSQPQKQQGSHHQTLFPSFSPTLPHYCPKMTQLSLLPPLTNGELMCATEPPCEYPPKHPQFLRH